MGDSWRFRHDSATTSVYPAEILVHQLLKVRPPMFFKRPKQTSNDNAPQLSPAPVSTIASNTVFEGNLSTDGEIHIDGTVRGSVSAQLCVVDSNGVVEGEIVADEIIVRGRVVGPMRAYHVHLQSGANVAGDVINETIAVDSGAQLQGAVWRTEDPHAGRTAAEPALPLPVDKLSYQKNQLWSGADADGFRPLTAIRPR